MPNKIRKNKKNVVLVGNSGRYFGDSERVSTMKETMSIKLRGR